MHYWPFRNVKSNMMKKVNIRDYRNFIIVLSTMRPTQLDLIAWPEILLTNSKNNDNLRYIVTFDKIKHDIFLQLFWY